MKRQLAEDSKYRNRLMGLAVAAVVAAGCGGDLDGSTGDHGPGAEEGWGDSSGAHEIRLADQGRAQLPIVVGVEADPSIEVAAEELSDYLGEISGASFDIVDGEPRDGIVVGTPEEFDELPAGVADVEFEDGPFDMEDYVIRSTDEGLYLLGATPVAARFAVWDLLYRFGHRQFFPTDNWEVVPEEETLEIAVDVYERPDYYSRQAPRGAMLMRERPWAQAQWEDWQIRNRTAPTFTLSTGHVYDGVIANNQSEFDDNPEYWGEIDGERTEDAQPNVAHEDVQQMFLDHAHDQFEDEPDRHSVPMDPRDGNYWSESDESRQIGGPSEQSVFLANRVAEEIVDNYGEDKYVGMYGYSHHSPPPEIDVHENVIVSLATSYIRGGYTFEEMLDGWSERAEMIGIREYYGLWEWHYSLPGKARAADTEYLAETIPHFHDRGARFINAESNDTWGGYGLGYYLASRMLWNVDEAERVDELIDDFLHRAFGPAAEVMGQFYELIDGSASDPHVPERQRPLNDDMVGRMYRLLDEARQIAGDDDEVRARIDDLILYTRYVDLYREFETTDGAQRQDVFDELVGYAWRIRDRMMTESIELTRYINREVETDDNLEWGSGYEQNRPADRHRQGADEPVSDAEIEQWLQTGIESNALVDLDIDVWEHSGDLEPAGFNAGERGELVDRANRGDVDAVMATDDGTLPALTISAGHVYDDRGPVQWSLEDDQGQLVDHGEVVPDGEEYRFELSVSEPGVYDFSITNAGQGFVWDYEPRGASVTLQAGGQHELERNWYDELFFFVPEGTGEFHLAGHLLEDRYEFVAGDGQVLDSDDVDVLQDYIRVDVPAGADGTVWSLDLKTIRPEIRFLDIPGYVALSPEELILPGEVLE